MLPVELLGVHVQPDSGAPVLLLRDRNDPRRVLPIFIGGPEALAIVVALSGEDVPRPLTADLTATLVSELGGTLVGAEVTDVQDGTFIAVLRFEAAGRTIEVDARPSDAIALALRLDAPISVDEHVLDTASVQLSELPTPEEIDQEVETFRRELDEVGPGDFRVTDQDEGGDETRED